MNGRALEWPFFDDEHRAFADAIESWLEENPVFEDEAAPDSSVRTWVRALGDAGWLRACIDLDVRALCLARERLAYRSALADFAFAMQGLGSGAISLFGSPAMRSRYLDAVAAGKSIAAFALSEREAGSDVAAMTTHARRDGDRYIISGEKTWISNATIADFFVVFARTGMAESGAKGISAFILDAGIPGFEVRERIETISPHPLGVLAFNECAIPVNHRLGEEGEGFAIAMATLDVFRTTVGAAALGFARRAYDETRAHAKSRQLFGAPLAALQLTQAAIADMAVDIDASALLVYRAAWTKDCGAERVTREAAMAKLYATEAAGRICDRAVQLFGGRGVTHGEIVERLYRDVRALRIYEGASEVQKLVIARASFEG
ncbi:MAG TPA: acyl-CoA dehydrogenase family protein [Candidatus Baltobacteraceae bacterium]|nr:acyl-CoA dehydrogenase family protein [Candidatus Baltobacteraceae bacterium]